MGEDQRADGILPEGEHRPAAELEDRDRGQRRRGGHAPEREGDRPDAARRGDEGLSAGDGQHREDHHRQSRGRPVLEGEVRLGHDGEAPGLPVGQRHLAPQELRPVVLVGDEGAFRGLWSQPSSSERGSRVLNPDHVEMAPDAMVPINASPKQFIVVVAGGGAPNYNELQPAFAWGTFGGCTVLPIAKWR